MESEAAQLREVRRVIELIRPAIQGDGGDVEVVGVQGGTVSVRFHGECVDCPSRSMTLTHGILASLKANVPGITQIQVVD